MQVVEAEIPAEYLEQAQQYRELLIEAAAEGNDELTHKYLEGEALTEEEIRAGHPRRHAALCHRAGALRRRPSAIKACSR